MENRASIILTLSSSWMPSTRRLLRKMPTRTYKIRSISRRRVKGITSPSVGSLDAVLKFDSVESEHCVYNEYVAMRLAQTLHVPVADGVLGVAGDGPLFASLQLSSPGMRLPDPLESQWEAVARQYPEECAAVEAFDLLIGNGDRFSNFKAGLATPHMRIFAAFDHSHALLSIADTVHTSLDRLRSMDPLIRNHPFLEYTDPWEQLRWAERIAAVPDFYFRECCELGRPFRCVNQDTQKALADALIIRKFNLPAIVRSGYDLLQDAKPQERDQ